MNRLRAWATGFRPRTLTAAAAPVLLGTGLAAAHEAHRPGPAAAALAGALLIQVGTNLANDYYDHRRGGDTAARVGPLRVTQAGLLPPATVRNGAFAALGAALLVGVYLVGVGGWPVAVIGVASLVSAVAYTGGPYPLAYHGLGDLFVFVFFGLVAVGGTYWVQALGLGAEVLVAGAGMGAMNTAILVLNNLRDLDTDARAGKRTLAVRLGVRGTRWELFLLLAAGLSIPPLGVLTFGWTPWALVALGAALALLRPCLTVRAYRRGDDPRVLIPPLGEVAIGAGLYGLLLGAGLAFG
jgi:1,4-dihydroxy-2-naphthoate octaprenyltransferase